MTCPSQATSNEYNRLTENRNHTGLASTSSTQTQNPAYPLYPSVVQLLHEKSVPESEISKIPASGPKGRLLKGDILAYLGTIPADYPSNQASRIEKLAHLDLSNIKIAPAPIPKPEAKEAEPTSTPTPTPPPMVSVALSIPLSTVLYAQRKIQKSLGITVSLSEFLIRATDLANESLPRSKGEQSSAEELFDEILGADPITTSHGDYIPDLNAVEMAQVDEAGPDPEPVQEDLLDFLSGNVSRKSSASASRVEAPVRGGRSSAENVFSLTVPVGEEKRARTFLDRVESLLTVEPGRLVL